MRHDVCGVPAAAGGKGVNPGDLVPLGPTCTHQNVMDKGEYRQVAAELGVAIVCPDTSPRGHHVPDDKNDWKFRKCGAGFYLDATQEPYAKNYRMASYVVDQLPGIVARNFPVDMSRQGIFPAIRWGVMARLRWR